MSTLKLAAAFAAILIASTTIVEAKPRHKHYRHYAPAQTQTFAWGQEYQPQYQSQNDAQIVDHPAGCPRTLFCGCGVSIKVFGRPVKDLFLASNWLKFPRTTPAPGMVAARRGHVMLIMAMDANGNATVYDPNSGGHKTRIHTRSLAGYRVVNPHGSQTAHL